MAKEGEEMSYTTFRKMHRDELSAMRAAIKTAISGPLRWRRHGIGLLQAYLHEARSAGEPEVRVHIWHPSARRDGIGDHGDIHNHRFDFDSSVIVGSIEHSVYPVTDTSRDWGAFEVVNARKDVGARYQLDPSIQPFGLGCADRYHFTEGMSYSFCRGKFHRSNTDGLAITVITKRNQCSDKALVVARLDTPPVHAFEENDDFDIDPIVNEAINALSVSLAKT